MCNFEIAHVQSKISDKSGPNCNSNPHLKTSSELNPDLSQTAQRNLQIAHTHKLHGIPSSCTEHTHEVEIETVQQDT